ncbi:MAG: pre-peptidase C-terminal domain-containing protein [Pyrinomonadaceae bacterium]|nr:pre-peptidase C-terminal domain-containing protein [Pyrinomonadaceae bacterium]
MKRNLKLVALLVIAVLVCSGTLALTLAREERSEAASIQEAASAPADSAPAAINQGGKNYRQDVAKVLKRHDSVELEPQRVAEQVRQTGRVSIPTAEGTFELNLAPHDMLAPNYRAQVTVDGGEVRSLERGPVRTYKGTVSGMDGAQARFTIDENTLEGLIITPSRLYFVEPAKRYSALAGSKDFIVYEASDLIQTSFGECGVTLAEKVGAEAARVKSQVPTSLARDVDTGELFSPPRAVDLATEADFEYFTAFGSNEVAARNEIISIVNQVDGIYNTQFGLRFSIVFQNVWATSSDPYTTADPDMALDEFRDYWNANHGPGSPSPVARDLAHMWTGKDFDDPGTPQNETTIGIAYRPGLDCPLGPVSYGMSQKLTQNPTPAKFLLTAHEIGHNFNARHPDQVVPVPPLCENTIMSSSLGGGTLQQFCTFSVDEIQTRADSRVACLSQVITPGCTYSLSPTSQSFPVSGGPGSTNVTTVGPSCAWGATSSVSWIRITSGSSGTNNGTVNFSVDPNPAGFARSGLIRIADQSFTVSQAGATACAVIPISYGQTINASLSTSDCRSSQRSTSYADQYSFSGVAGDQIRIEMTSMANPVLDTYLYLIGPGGTVLTENDDNGQNLNSRIPVSGFFTLPAAGLYVIESTSFDDNEVGTYTLVLTAGASTPGNPIDGSQFFVTKHYEDFFGRQPDAPGLQFWVDGIDGCIPSPSCREVKRIDTSAAFFLSIEFQETGYLVYRLYKAAYGDLAGAPFPVRRAAFIPDTRTIGNGVVVGQAGWEQVLENNKQSFVGNFVNQARFTNANPTSTTPAEFVDTLFARAGVIPSSTDRQAAIAEFAGTPTSADTAARARALRRVAENSLLRAQEFNKAFVLMQYFGYLQRNPDDAPDNNLAGFNFWLAKLNQFNGDFRQAEMVKAFISSGEYRSRFGPP